MSSRQLPAARSRLPLLLLTKSTLQIGLRSKHFPQATFAKYANVSSVSKCVRGQAIIQCALCFPYANDTRGGELRTC